MIIVPTILAWVRLLVQKMGYYNTSTGAALFALSASMIYVALILWNASSINLASKERRRADARMREAAEMKTEFVAIVSHELRTPLTSIKIAIDVVHDEQNLTDSERKNYLVVAKRNVDRLARLINEVLDFQKLEAGREEFKLLPHGVNEIVAEVAETFAAVVREKGLELTLALEPGLPPVVCDRDRISQVVINFTNNAVKFAGRGRVTLKTQRANGAVRVSVHDEGPGIAPEDRKRLFNSFTQIVASGKAKEGTGLGLSICRKIIEHHDGTIGVESEPGQGTTFFFALPIGREPGTRT
jgi:signal transduction histidine kinase